MVDFGGLNDAGRAIGLGGWRSLVNNGASCCKTRRLASPVLKINNHATGGWRTKDILGGQRAGDLKTGRHRRNLRDFRGFCFLRWEDQSRFQGLGLLPLSTRGTVCESIEIPSVPPFQNGAISARPTAQVSVAPVTM